MAIVLSLQHQPLLYQKSIDRTGREARLPDALRAIDQSAGSFNSGHGFDLPNNTGSARCGGAQGGESITIRVHQVRALHFGIPPSGSMFLFSSCGGLPESVIGW
jgi:hypothetical protein